MSHKTDEVRLMSISDDNIERQNIRKLIVLANGDSLLIRSLCAGDEDRLRRFDAELSPTSRGFFIPHAYDEATLARVMERAAAGEDLIYLALAGTDVAAYFFLWHIRQPIPTLGIGIADAYQNQGVGRQMLTLLIEDARALQRDGIDLTTMLTNERAFALYQKMGFRYLGNVDNTTGDGHVITERWLFLPLKPDSHPCSHSHQAPV